MATTDHEILAMARHLADIQYCGGWRHFEGMGISCIGAYDYAEDRWRVFTWDNRDEFAELGFPRMRGDRRHQQIDSIRNSLPGLTLALSWRAIFLRSSAAIPGTSPTARTGPGFAGTLVTHDPGRAQPRAPSEVGDHQRTARLQGAADRAQNGAGILEALIAFAPQQQGLLYLALNPGPDGPGGVFRGTDGGLNWRQIAQGLPGRVLALAPGLLNPNSAWSSTLSHRQRTSGSY
jgi:hypothetical protein